MPVEFDLKGAFALLCVVFVSYKLSVFVVLWLLRYVLFVVCAFFTLFLSLSKPSYNFFAVFYSLSRLLLFFEKLEVSFLHACYWLPIFESASGWTHVCQTFSVP